MTDIICTGCGTEMPGENNVEALEDARNIGWEERPFQGLVCADCIIEEGKL